MLDNPALYRVSMKYALPPPPTTAGGLAQGNSLFNKFLLPTHYYAKQVDGGAALVNKIDKGPALVGLTFLLYLGL